MNEPMFIFRDIATVFAGAFIASLLFWRLRQPLILGYVFAGLLLSPLTPGPQVHDVRTFEMMAEVGVILLMFSVGIEFSVPDLLRVKWVALIGAPVGISLSIGLGVVAGIVLGWPLPRASPSAVSSALPAPWFSCAFSWIAANSAPNPAA